ncbi:MAG: autotransporter-associated beta strand repeat-containing protein, partial [Verrucomicrobia bacterium]|nr:autotransporter-associated beta strand repeat-containing protein [Verrucomicrobiota bacterium]
GTPDWAYVSGGTPTAFANGVEVILDDTATNLMLNLAVTVSPVAVTFNSTKNYLIQGAGGISGGGGLAKLNSGILTLATTNTYTGDTTVSNGTLLVNGALAGGNVTVAGGTLGGSGSIGGPVSMAPGGTLAPGGASGGGNFSLGTLTVNGAVTLAGTTAMEISKDGLLSRISPGLSPPPICPRSAAGCAGFGIRPPARSRSAAAPIRPTPGGMGSSVRPWRMRGRAGLRSRSAGPPPIAAGFSNPTP